MSHQIFLELTALKTPQTKRNAFNDYCYFFIADMNHIYTSRLLDPDFSPRTLQNKVQFDLRFYFARRGTENMYQMKKDYFKLVYDAEHDICYLELAVDEETKNHKEITNDLESIFMPEIKDSKYCIVTSFLTYEMSLNRDSDLTRQAKNELIP